MLTVHFLIHGYYIPSIYGGIDGPITEESKKFFRQIDLPVYEKVFCGPPIRCLETASQIAIDLSRFHMIGALGNDDLMLKALREEDDTAIIRLCEFLETQKRIAAGKVSSIVAITDPFYPLALIHHKRGGKEKLGPLPAFIELVIQAQEIKAGQFIPINY